MQPAQKTEMLLLAHYSLTFEGWIIMQLFGCVEYNTLLGRFFFSCALKRFSVNIGSVSFCWKIRPFVTLIVNVMEEIDP